MDPAVVPYHPGWVAAFEAERDVLRRVLAAWLVSDIEHVGSTSVPGMPAKPVIDMLAGVARLERRWQRGRGARRAGVRLPAAPARGTAVPQDRPRYWPGHPPPAPDRTRQRAVGRAADVPGRAADAALAREYAAWKRQHGTDDPAGAYDATKTPFAARVLAARGVPVKPDHLRRQSATPPPRGCP